MNYPDAYGPLERLFDCIGEIEDAFLAEAETIDIAAIKAVKRKKMMKYGGYGVAGVAAVSVGMVVAYRLIKAKSA